MPKKKILVVDDVPFNIELMTALLQDEYHVSTACNGVQALKVALTEKPDLVLLDLCMPEFDGEDVCEILKRDATTKHIPVVFVTAVGDKTVRDRCMQLGGLDYIVKPVDVKQLVTVVQRTLQ